MTTRTLLLGAVATIAFGFAANAQERNGWYIGLEGGGNWIGDTSAVSRLDRDVGLDTTSAGDIPFSEGWAAIATVGHHFAQNWRWEVEVGYRSNDLDGTSGEANEWSGMLNVLYDIPLGRSLALSLGAGAGADNMEFKSGPVNGFQDRDWNFAYQGIAGLTVAVSDRIDLFANYRYLRVHEPDFTSRVIGPAGLQHIELDDVAKHTATIGLRYNFGAKAEPPPPPPPVAPPPPPPAAPKEFIVFFGHNKSNLTPEAMDVVRQAASAAKEYGSATITVVGHADKSGSPAYNEKLSLRRADGVKGALVGEGIEAGKISTSGRGESDPMVPTEDGVREPQNRRVHINL